MTETARPTKETQLRILIVRVGAMGDVIHALPAVAMLRSALPDAHIGWAIEPRWAPLLQTGDAAVRDPERMPLVDAVHRVEAKQWNQRPFSMATVRSVLALRTELRAARYGLAIDLQGTLRSAVIARLSGARHVVGSATPRESIARHLYHTRVPTTATHVVDQAEQIVWNAAQPYCLSKQSEGHALSPEWPGGKGPTVALPRDPAAETWWMEQKQTLCGDRLPILLAATAGWGAKEWPPENFAALAAALAAGGFCVLLNNAPGAADSVSANVLGVLRSRHPQAVPHVHPLPATLPQLIAATRAMHAVIAGDTGPLHLAEALGVPTVGLFGPTAPMRTGTRRNAVSLRDAASVTDHQRHARAEAGLARITVEQVLAALHSVAALP